MTFRRLFCDEPSLGLRQEGLDAAVQSEPPRIQDQAEGGGVVPLQVEHLAEELVPLPVGLEDHGPGRRLVLRLAVVQQPVHAVFEVRMDAHVQRVGAVLQGREAAASHQHGRPRVGEAAHDRPLRLEQLCAVDRGLEGRHEGHFRRGEGGEVQELLEEAAGTLLLAAEGGRVHAQAAGRLPQDAPVAEAPAQLPGDPGADLRASAAEAAGDGDGGKRGHGTLSGHRRALPHCAAVGA